FKAVVNGEVTWLAGDALYMMAGLVALTIGIILLVPKLTKAVPPSLVAIIVVFLVVMGLGIDTKMVKDIASVGGGLPPFHVPQIPFTLETLQIIFPYALIMAGVGLTESLLTLNLVDEITGTRGSGNRESVAQGTANVLNG